MQGTLTFAPSSMTGYRARLTPQDAAPLTWHIPDCAPLLKVGQASFVFPRAIKDHVFYIVSLPSTCATLSLFCVQTCAYILILYHNLVHQLTMTSSCFTVNLTICCIVCVLQSCRFAPQH